MITWLINNGEVIEPTCTEDGYTLRTCTVCGQDVKTEIVVMLGHDYRRDPFAGIESR